MLPGYSRFRERPKVIQDAPFRNPASFRNIAPRFRPASGGSRGGVSTPLVVSGEFERGSLRLRDLLSSKPIIKLDHREPFASATGKVNPSVKTFGFASSLYTREPETDCHALRARNDRDAVSDGKSSFSRIRLALVCQAQEIICAGMVQLR